MKSVIDLSNWNRKEHFEFFNSFDEPFFGIVAEIDCSAGLRWCRENHIKFFHYYLFQSLKAVNQTEEFKTRIEDHKPVFYNTVHASSTIGRPDKTFGFSFIPFTDDFTQFSNALSSEVEEVVNSKGLRLNNNTTRNDVIHFSSLPWINFKGLSHARKFSFNDSVPKITFGKVYEAEHKQMMPVSVNAHHGLMDAWHVSSFLELFESLMNQIPKNNP